jgi:VanZ family protein
MGQRSGSNFIRFWFPAFIYSGIIFIASSIPDVRTPLPEFEFDKLLHVIEYVPFGFLVVRAMRGTWASMAGKTLGGWVVLLSFLYAASDEYHQLFVHGRDIGGFDLVADTVGGIMGGYLYKVYSQKTGKI